MKKVSLEKLCTFEKGQTGLASATAGNYPLVTTAKERKNCNTFQFDTRAVCIPLVSSTGHGHASLNNVHYQEGKFALGSILVAVIPKDEKVLNAQFLHLYLSKFKDTVLVPLMSGAANVSLSISKIKTVEIPLPSIDKQLEIVSRFNNTETELAELLGEISTQEGFVKKLRQSILQEAIEGKLTAKWREENPVVESASVLLEKIEAEKEKLVRDGKIKKEKPLPPIKEDEIPFDIPESWSWCRLGNIGLGFRGKSPIYNDASTYKAINQKCVRWGYVDLEYAKSIDSKWLNSIDKFILTTTNDLLVNSTGEGTIGRSAQVDISSTGYIYDSHVLLFRAILCEAFYIVCVINGSFGQNQIDDSKGAKSTKQTELGVDKLRCLTIPFPPQEEQKVIVEKIDNLFAMCDELEEQIKASESNTEALTKAILKEAFES